MKTFTLLSLFISSFLFAQSDENRVLAWIGETPVYESEFTERYEFTPLTNKHRKDNSLSAKLDFLYTLIAEKIWAKEAEDSLLFNRPDVSLAITSLEKMYMRDALYKIEITDKIFISDEEVALGAIKNAKTLYINFIFSKEEDAIYKLYNLLNEGIEFKTILNERPEKNEQLSPIEVNFGDMVEKAENLVYDLEPGKYSSPILTNDGWYIFYLSDRKERLFHDSKSREDALNFVKKTIKKRKEEKLLAEFRYNFFKGKKAETNGPLFEKLAEKLKSLFLMKKQNSNKTEGTELLHLDANDVLEIESYFGNEELSRNFLSIGKKQITLKRFLRETAFDGFNVEIQYVDNLRSILDYRVKNFIEFEFLTQECFARGLNYLPEVVASMKMWQDNYLFQSLKGNLIDGTEIPDSSLRQYYNQRYKPDIIPTQVDIIEIFVSELSVAQIISEKLKAAEDFSTLAKTFSEKKPIRSGYFPSSTRGEVGRIASTLEPGENYGPIKNNNGYSFIQLLDKKEGKSLPPSKSFDEIKNQLKIELKQLQMAEKYLENTVSFAKKRGIKINLENLNSTDVTTINSFAIRHMGFGGKITAVPLLAPYTEWVEILKKTEKNLP